MFRVVSPLYDRSAPSSGPFQGLSCSRWSCQWWILTRLDYGRGTLAGLVRHLMDRLQLVINAAAWLVFSARKYDQITPLLRELHWLGYPERISYRLAVHAFWCQHNLVSSYRLDVIHHASDVDYRRQLRSASTVALIIPRSMHSTIGDRAFSHCRGECMEHLAGRRHICAVTAVLQMETENWTF